MDNRTNNGGSLVKLLQDEGLIQMMYILYTYVQRIDWSSLSVKCKQNLMVKVWKKGCFQTTLIMILKW